MSTVFMRSPASSHEWSLLGKIWAACKTYRVRRQHHLAERTLAGLSDHTLKDMGISRCEIYSRVYGPSNAPRLKLNQDRADS
jgi:uncharacterized protein YjiS (DUF1127 family)